MAALRAVSSTPAPVQRQRPPEPAHVADRGSMAEATLRLTAKSDQHANDDEAPGFGKGPPPERQPGRLDDALIRLTGLCAFAFAAGLTHWLYRYIHAAPAPGETLARYALVAIAFLAGSLGAALLLLGRHVHEPIAISARWRSRL